MIAIDKIVRANLYSQDDATFLLGTGFSGDAAREAITEACRSGQLKSRKWRRRYWFTGASFLSWVGQWYGSEVKIDTEVDEENPLARALPLGDNEPRRLGARSPENGKEVGT